MARNGLMKSSPKARTMNVAFWGKNKNNTTKSDIQSGVEAINRRNQGGHTNKSTDAFIKKQIEEGNW